MKKKTPDEKVKEPKKSELDSEQIELILKENQTYKTLLSMQNENYFRAELVESSLLIANQVAQLNSTINTRLEDLIKVLLNKKD